MDVRALATLLNRDGYLTEGAASNTFIVKNKILLAPPKSHLMLPGITYDVVLELAASNQIPYEVREIAESEVRNADEILLTSSTKEIMPIPLLDNKPVGSGKPGEIFGRLHALYQHYKATQMRGQLA